MTIEELEKRQDELAVMWDELQVEINALKKAQAEEAKPKPPHPRWTPERDEHYYTIDIGGACAGWETWDSDNLDGDIYSLGFVFKTEAEADFALERLKVLAEMREWAGHNYDGAYIYYHRPSDEIMVNWDGDSTNCFGDIRFKCVDDAENCIKAVGADRIKKYYFMIPEEETNND